jgi:hypothetical protein
MAVIRAGACRQFLSKEMEQIMNIEPAALPVSTNLMSWGEWWELWGDKDTDAAMEMNIEFDVD